MAQWQVMKTGAPLPQPVYDDGLLLSPGDEGFSNAAALAYAEANGGDSVSYVGLSPGAQQ